jgi:hypothetical protein
LIFDLRIIIQNYVKLRLDIFQSDPEAASCIFGL